MSPKALFILNPKAGKGQIRSRFLDIVDILVKDGYEVTVRTTQARQDAFETAKKQAGRFDLVVCAGGDGTLNETVSGIVESGAEVPLGYIPAGTTNDFAATLKLPLNPVKAAEQIVLHNEKKCDIARINSKYFVYSAAFGAFTDVPYITPQRSKNALGWMAYFFQGVEHIADLKAYRMCVSTPLEQVEGEFIFGMVTNSESIAGIKGLPGQTAILDDGEYEVLLIRTPRTLVELNNSILSLMRKDTSAPGLVFMREKKLRLEAESPVAWTLDGEFGGSHLVANIEVLNKRVTFLR